MQFSVYRCVSIHQRRGRVSRPFSILGFDAPKWKQIIGDFGAICYQITPRDGKPVPYGITVRCTINSNLYLCKIVQNLGGEGR